MRWFPHDWELSSILRSASELKPSDKLLSHIPHRNQSVRKDSVVSFVNMPPTSLLDVVCDIRLWVTFGNAVTVHVAVDIELWTFRK